jgi:hypothetical protein
LFDLTLPTRQNVRSMPRRNRIFLAIAVFVAILLAIVVLFPRLPPGAAAADGRRLTIEKITWGTDHSFTLGKLWVRVLKPILGTPWAARRGCVEIHFTNAEPALMVWTRWTGISMTNPLPVEATILDQQGTESEMVVCRWNQSDFQIQTNRFESTSYVGWIFGNYPRRSRTLSMRIYDQKRQHRERPVVEMAFANPAPTKYPQWSGERLPMTRTNNGGTEFTLKAVTAESTGWWAHFQTQTDGARSWQTGGITTRDVTGNSATRRIIPAASLNRHGVFALPGALWPGERAWRFSVEFCRGGEFADDELWTTPSLALQPASAATSVAITNFSLNGSTLMVWQPQLRAEAMPWPGKTGQSAGIGARLDAGSAPLRLFLVRAVDEQNREVQIDQSPSSFSMGWYHFEFLVPARAQSLRFTFAVRKSVMIDFDVAAESVMSKPNRAR